MLISRVSPRTKETNTREINVTQAQLDAWQNTDVPIQTVMPHISEDDREFIMTGYTPEDWEAIFNAGD